MTVIVTVVYNKLDLVKQSVEAVLENAIPPYLYILVYNDSPYEGVWEYLESVRKIPGQVVIVKNKENLGLSQALSQGHKIALGSGAHFFFKIDDDTVALTKGFNYLMVDALLRHGNLGILSADIDSGKQVGPSTVEHLKGYQFETFESPCVGGALTLYPMWLFKEIGFFRNFGYYAHEDGEFSQRVATRTKLKTAYLLNVKCQHLGRTKESDPLLDAWKLETWNGKTRLEFREWKQRKEEQDAIRPTASRTV